MARLTVKWLRDEVNATMSHYWSDLVRRERQLKEYCDQLYFRLDFQANAIAVESTKISEQSKKIEQLIQLAKQQAEVIEALTGKLEELVGDHNALCQAVEDIGDSEALNHQWLDRQQQRIVALEKRETQGFTLTESNSMRLELHGKWISDLFNRINESEVKE